MQLQLQQGRPATEEGRLEKEIRTYDLLDKTGVEYWSIDHEAAFTMEACEKIDKVLCTPMCKNLFLCNRQKTDFYLLLMPGDKPFKTKDLSKQIGSSRLSFADAEDMELVMAIGGTEASVAWEDNESVDAIRDLADSGGIEINMSMYGGFEQVGSIGQSIPRNDEQTTTKAGDFSAGRYLKKALTQCQ